MAKREVATLAGGCFWCLEAVFDQMDGVESVESGYIGGHVENPTYKQVCNGDSGHAEAVQITFDPEVTTYRELLEVFFAIHDPTTRDRQGNDEGPQYRSAIFYHSDEQRHTAEQLIAELESAKAWPNPIVTQLSPATKFYAAENYHQEYFANNSWQPYCQFVVAPKVLKFREKYSEKLKSEAR